MEANIDLTEHRDFSEETNDWNIDIPTDLYEDTIMDSEQYNRILRWESIFGKKRRYPNKNNIFNKPSDRLFIPWKMSTYKKYFQHIRIPWKSEYVVFNRDPARDLFNSR